MDGYDAILAQVECQLGVEVLKDSSLVFELEVEFANTDFRRDPLSDDADWVNDREGRAEVSVFEGKIEGASTKEFDIIGVSRCIDPVEEGTGRSQ